MFKSTASVSYRERVEGTWGEFATPTGRVAFILTKARLGASGVDLERRLTSKLYPVREVLKTEQLDFNQLLQRDLDDHRVVEKLIPYLLKPGKMGPAFFPPIMAVLLPFNSNSSPISSFPEKSFDKIEVDSEMGARFAEIRHGAAYRVQRLVDDHGEWHRIRLGRLDWNEELSKLVVLDGQHRAMALLAIDRTINGTWDQVGGKYRHFYEARVRQLLKEAGKDLDLNKIEIPVTVCWFPDLGVSGGDPHKAARKLFVDVNKEARTPSESRLTLLSDTELQNIFTRALLNRLRQPDPPLPIYAIEYDNPKKDAWKPAKWTVLTSLFLLKYAVQRCVFGPRELIHNLSSSLSLGGRPPRAKMDKYMREQLDISTLFTIDSIPDGDRSIARGEIGNDTVPTMQIDRLVERFMQHWGEPILTILSGLRPYASHWKALQHLRDSWIGGEAKSDLARDALFEGVGIYWTILDSYSHWLELGNNAREDGLPEPSKTEIVRVWEIIEGREAEFVRLRAREYLEKKKEFGVQETERNSPELDRAEDMFKVTNTNACQLGAILAFASLALHNDTSGESLSVLARQLVAGWNSALASKRTATENRLLIFSTAKSIKNPINKIVKLDTPFAVHFRYFWLELLRLKSAQEHIRNIVRGEILDSITKDARAHYAEYLLQEQFRHEKAANEDPSASDTWLREKARKRVEKDLADALEHWFEMNKHSAHETAVAAMERGKAKGVSVAKTSPAAEHAGAHEHLVEEDNNDDIDAILSEGPPD